MGGKSVVPRNDRKMNFLRLIYIGFMPHIASHQKTAWNIIFE